MVEFSDEQQAKVDELVGSARKSAREKAEADYKAKLEAQKQEKMEAALEDQKEWKSLAEKHKARVKELEPLADKVERYESVIQEMLDAKVKDLDAKKAVEALPDGMSTLDKLTWLNANVDLFKPQEKTPGTPKKPTRKQGEPSRSESRRRVSL